MELSRQEYWSGFTCPPLGDLPNPGIEPSSPALQVDSLLQGHLGSPANGVCAGGGTQVFVRSKDVSKDCL